MSSQRTWSYVAEGSAVLAGLAGIAGAIGGATEDKTLTAIGGISAEIAKAGILAATAGAFSRAPLDQQSAALVQGAPLVAAMNAGTTALGAQLAKNVNPARDAVAPAVDGVGGPLAGIAQAVGEILALPFRILAGLLGGGGKAA